MGEAARIPASEKAPKDFLPPEITPVVKKVVEIVVTRSSGDVEKTVVILRPGDVATIGGVTVAEG